MKNLKIPIIDLFAGPGGLGEGFSSVLNKNDRVFDIKLSIEKDEHAHKTLRLRSFYRQFKKEEVPELYYNYIKENKDNSFFIYLAHSLSHVPLFASNNFMGTSERGLYGDVIEEIDWSVGQILDKLKTLGIAENTFIFFTSDNGPWLVQGEEGGSAGLLREGKGSTWEGGMREPAIAWWPGRIISSSSCLAA